MYIIIIIIIIIIIKSLNSNLKNIYFYTKSRRCKIKLHLFPFFCKVLLFFRFFFTDTRIVSFQELKRMRENKFVFMNFN